MYFSNPIKYSFLLSYEAKPFALAIEHSTFRYRPLHEELTVTNYWETDDDGNHVKDDNDVKTTLPLSYRPTDAAVRTTTIIVNNNKDD